MLEQAFADDKFVITVEEGMLMGGFGSAVLEAAADLKLDTRNMHRIGIPDIFVEHGDRSELLADIKLDAKGIASVAREAANPSSSVERSGRSIA